MKATTLFNQFLKENSYLAPIAKAVIKQMGGASSYTLAELSQVRNAEDGYSGFIYYSDTVAFWKRVRKIAVPYMEEEAQQLGEHSALDMVRNFGYFTRQGNEPDNREIALALYGSMRDIDTFIPNLLSWYCLETVANQFSDYCYENNYDNEFLENLK